MVEDWCTEGVDPWDWAFDRARKSLLPNFRDGCFYLVLTASACFHSELTPAPRSD
jgi:hypothetical protein